MFVRITCPQYKTLCVYYSQGGTREPIIYFHMSNKQGDQKFDHPCPQGLSFCGQTWKFDIGLIMQSKSRTQRNLCFRFVKTSYIYVAQYGFLCFTFLILLCVIRSLFIVVA